MRFHSILALAILGGASLAAGAPPKALAPFLDQHCTDCHDAADKKGGLDLTGLSTDATDGAAHKKWVRVFDRVLAGEMPPPKKARPAAAEQRAFLTALGSDLVAKHTAQKGAVLRRLNRREYQNSLNDLLGVNVDVIDMLPEDGRAHGFDNIGEALSISGLQMQRYMEAAELALNAALLNDAKPETQKETFTLESERNREFIGKHWLKRPDGAIVVFNNGGYPGTEVPGLRAKFPGLYRLRIAGYGYQTESPVAFAIIAGTFNRGGDNRVHSYQEVPPDKPATVEVMLHLRAGDGIKLSPQGLFGPDGHSSVKDGPDKYPGSGFALLSVELDGPIIQEWPPRGQKLLLGDAKIREDVAANAKGRFQRGYKPKFTAEPTNAAADSRKNLTAFITAAFRRPATAADTAPYFALFDSEYAQNHDYLDAMRSAAIAVMCAPEFLYQKAAPGRLDEYALASRLSYFLTRTAPDAELLRVAASKQLTNPAVLRAQTERLLNGPSIDRFVTDFTDGWLNLRDIDFTTPDKQLYPEFDGVLQDSMLRETRSFIGELIRKNLPLSNLIQSDFAMLNSRLARHYGLPAVSGLAIQKVKLPADSKRGGILTHGSILKVSANGTNTSPVIRGVWVMDRILGMEPPPPPPGVPGVEPDIRGAKTMREILEKHRSMESCNGCHRVIDPPGFALESYDVIGGWRDRFRSIGEGEQVNMKVEGRRVRYRLGPAVDAAGQLTDGAKFKDIVEFQKLLLASQEKVARCVTEKLLTFGTGREMGFSDRLEIQRIAAATMKKGGFRDLIHEVVQCEIFRSK